MWDFLARQILRQALKQSGKQAMGLVADEANGPEAYADRIKRDFHLNDYNDAWDLYGSDPGYWEQYYRQLPNLEPTSEMVRDSALAAGIPSRNNVFEFGFPQPSDAGSSNDADARYLGKLRHAADSPSLATDSPAVQSGVGTIGQSSGEPPVGFLSPRYSNPLGSGIAGWPSSVDPAGPRYAMRLAPSPQQPGGLLGMLLDHLRNDPATMDPVTPR